MQQHAATCSNMQQHAATCSNMQQHAATCSNIQQHTATCSIAQKRSAACMHIAVRAKAKINIWCAQSHTLATHSLMFVSSDTSFSLEHWSINGDVIFTLMIYVQEL
jgi:hypothetical protein